MNLSFNCRNCKINKIKIENSILLRLKEKVFNNEFSDSTLNHLFNLFWFYLL